MKKLLIASSALVAAAGSAAALDVSLGGEIKVSAEFDADKSGFNGADWDAMFTLKASGESMGWTYGGTLKVGMFDTFALVENDNGVISSTAGDSYDVKINTMALQFDKASIYMGGDFMGKVAIQDSCGDFVEVSKIDATVGNVAGHHCLEWTGFEAAGFEIMAALALDELKDKETGLIIGAKGDVAGLAVAGEYDVVSEDYEATFDLSMGGLSLGADFSYDDDADDQYDYSVSVGTSVSGFDVTVEYSPEWRYGFVSGAAGPIAGGTNVVYDQNTTSALEYDKTDGTGAYHTGTAAKNSKDIMIEVKQGCWTFDAGIDPVDDFMGHMVGKDGGAVNDVANVADQFDVDIDGSGTDTGADSHVTGDTFGLYMWELGYECPLHDGFEIAASIGQDEQVEETGLAGLTGSIGATVTF